ncbi:acyloxyacyl hydrolase [Acidiluteibacter ferrifornacis]|uniref:Acyloxyacyl hydrolase n=1 Tax=Acidiluteibacter ferrifornacis TaxID=2692424 RepID=A0A6N9NQ32_9FLAO|nr:acyloxyacyl hydrolase [Acidiluteibacter ferrifornacis]NBG66505.1 hypothetical protein [Acidiluteibacter ferrifornacis]
MKQLSLLLLFFQFVPLVAQEEVTIHPYTVGVRSQYGFILNHSETMEFVTRQHISAFEVYWEKNTLGKNNWEQEYNLPKWGIAFYAAHFNQYIGNGYGLHPYISIPIINNRVYHLDFRMGAGLGYISNPFDGIDNFKNVAIGTPINAFLTLLLDSYFKLNDRTNLHTNIAFTHFSNASFAKPNLGINIPTIGIGLDYNFGEKAALEVNREIDFIRKEHPIKLSIRSGFGISESSATIDKKYISGIFSVAAEKQFTPKSKLGLETNVFQSGALIDELEALGEKVNSDLEAMQIGIGASHTLTFDRLGLYLQLGLYLKSKYKEEGNSYRRLGLIYSFDNKLSTHIILKTHAFKAEYVEFGIGYTL